MVCREKIEIWQNRKFLIGSIIFLFLTMAVGWTLYSLFGHQIVKSVYDGRSVGFLNKVITGQATYPVEHHFEIADKLFISTSVGVFAILCVLMISRVSGSVAVWFIVMIGLVLRVVIATRNPLFLPDFVLQEDAYYCFNIARNIALGNGIRHDSFNLTTGFQPLFVFLIVPIFKIVSNKLLAINLVMLLQTGVGLICALVLYKIAKLVSTQKIAGVIIAIWAFSPVFVKVDVNGLETNTALCMLCIIVYYYLGKFKYSDKTKDFDYIVLGALVGLGGLARVDILLLMPILFLDIVWCDFGRCENKLTLKRIFLTGSSGFLVVLPWFAYNLIVVKSILPSSGQAVRFISQAYGFRVFSTPGQYFNIGQIPSIYYWKTMIGALAAIRQLVASVFPVPAGLLVIIFGACLGAKSFINEIKKISFFLLFMLVIFFAYTCYIFGQWFFSRYFMPYAIGYLLLLAFSMKYISASNVARKHYVFFKHLSTVFISFIMFFLLSGSISMVWNICLSKDTAGYYKMAEWVNSNTEKNAIIGSFQTGMLGYYLERKFYGLDGKINQDALVAMKENTIDRYVKEKNIDYIMDLAWILNDLFINHSKNKEYLRKQSLVLSSFYDVYKIDKDQQE